ncbi:hypothetical protein NQ318_023558 [Aromia moschata]|uniref:PiggyBac transposable element-derived protein domain-containing protein n=1 Tax=Aromia moschata TaxID=1265417 RepID=A0AAV8YS00_9CUCU|nr:hypothetical protein NQ318_023558 [Aromia moschata]
MARFREKPIRFGYKVWCVNSKSAYLVYQGCIPNTNPNNQKKFGKAATPLLQFIQEFPQELQNITFRFYFDNFFTSINLVCHLKEEGYSSTGISGENRLPKNCPLRSVKQMKKTNRGNFDYASTTDKKGCSYKMMDNSVGTVVNSARCPPIFKCQKLIILLRSIMSSGAVPTRWTRKW